jgi:steroid 5-alpha reductase family enzyme
MTLPVAMKPITLAEGIAAGLATSALVLYAWTAHTSAGACWFKPLGCIAGDDAWARQVVLSVGLNFAVWLYSLRTLGSLGRSDSSIVDKLWSLTPVLACWHWLCCADPSSPGYPRLLLMTALCTAWGARLTANFARKGGFSGGEDYRWAVLRGWFGAADEGRISAEWELFNLVFICQAQQLVILAFTSPAAAAMLAPDIPINAVDVLAACGFVAALVGETIADEQMLAFQVWVGNRTLAQSRISGGVRRSQISRCSSSRHRNS